MILGIDYASVDENRPPNPRTLFAAGVRFAVLRATYERWADPTIKRDLAALRDAGITVGAYLFPVPRIGASALQHVDAFAAAMAGTTRPGVDLPPTLDVEFPGRGIAATGMSRTELVAWITDAVTLLSERFRCTPLIYTSRRVWDGTDTDALASPPTGRALTRCPLWLTRYTAARGPAAVGELDRQRVVSSPPAVPTAWGAGNVWIHQYQGDARGFAGTRQVDLDRWIPERSTSAAKGAWLRDRLGLPPTSTDADLTSAIRARQAERGLAIDGVVGPRTFAAIAWD